MPIFTVSQTGSFHDANNRQWEITTIPDSVQLRIGLKGESLDRQLLLDNDEAVILRDRLTQWINDKTLTILPTAN